MITGSFWKGPALLTRANVRIFDHPVQSQHNVEEIIAVKYALKVNGEVVKDDWTGDTTPSNSCSDDARLVIDFQ